MRFVLFYHSLVSDWNHSAAHFLRGVATELMAGGHSVRIFEPADGWSLRNLREQCGEGAIKAFHATYPHLRSTFFDPITLDLDEALADADVVIAHECNDPGFIRRLGEHRARSRSYKLLFHDAPHRPLENAFGVRTRCLTHFDGVLASGEALRRLITTPRAALPEQESEHAYIRRADGTTYVCPWQTRLRCLLAYGQMPSDGAPMSGAGACGSGSSHCSRPSSSSATMQPARRPGLRSTRMKSPWAASSNSGWAGDTPMPLTR